MKYIYIAFLFTFFTFDNNLYSQYLASSSGTGSGTTSSTTYVNVGMSASIDVTSINNVLVMSTFTCQLSSNNNNQRIATYQINDGTTSSGALQRSLSKAKTTDYGIGSVVSIFDVSSQSGSQTYNLQHSISNVSENLTTYGTTVAVCLTDNSANTLQSVSKVVSTPVVTTSSWASVTGSESGLITTTSVGGFFLAASIQTSSPDGDGVGSWVLQYSTDNSTWNDLGTSVNRSVSSGSEKGISNLVASLPSNTAAGDYYFRLAHILSSGISMTTDAANIVVVALGYGTNSYYSNFSDQTSSTSSNSTTAMLDMINMVITPSVNTDMFFAAQYNMSSAVTVTVEKPVFDLSVDDNASYTFNGYDQHRFISAGSVGSGVSVGLATSLISGTSYDVAARFSSDGTGGSVSTDNVVLVGFGLTSATVGTNPLPIELLDFGYAITDSKVYLNWKTANEVNNDYFTIQRSKNGLKWEEVETINGAGNSNHIIKYSYIDINPFSGESYYRLKQTDFDGEYSFSDVIVVESSINSDLYVSPNPSNGSIQIETKENIELIIYNTTGQEIYRNTVGANEIHYVDLTSQPKGFYFLTYLSHDKRVVKKLILK